MSNTNQKVLTDVHRVCRPSEEVPFRLQLAVPHHRRRYRRLAQAESRDGCVLHVKKTNEFWATLIGKRFSSSSLTGFGVILISSSGLRIPIRSRTDFSRSFQEKGVLHRTKSRTSIYIILFQRLFDETRFRLIAVVLELLEQVKFFLFDDFTEDDFVAGR